MIDNAESPVIYSIGHSNHPFDRFLALLQLHEIERVIDVRRAPYSRYVPWFNREKVRQGLAVGGIDYIYLGDLLGGTPGTGRTLPSLEYDRMIKDEGFLKGIGMLGEMHRAVRCAVMCAEGDPNRCHRKSIITPALKERGIDVIHILPDGTILHEGQSGLV